MCLTKIAFWVYIGYTKNHQQFVFSVEGNKVSAKALLGILTKMDLGIVKYHFELGAGSNQFIWR